MITHDYMHHKKLQINVLLIQRWSISSKQQEAVNICIETSNMNWQIYTWGAFLPPSHLSKQKYILNLMSMLLTTRNLSQVKNKYFYANISEK